MSNGIKIQYLNGLGLVAKSKRQIRSGQQYNQYFTAPLKTDPIINKDGSVVDTVEYCNKLVRSTLNDTKKIAPTLKRSSIEQTCLAIFSFIYDHIQYEEDKPGVEQLRRPARTWADRKGDCDCMSIFASSVLMNLGIPHSFRIVKMYGRTWFQHIYVVVPKFRNANMNKKSDYIVIDPVLDKFNQEAPKINAIAQYRMENKSNLSGIPIQYLNGVEDSLLGDEFEGLEGFNGTEDELYGEFLGRMKKHLINTHAFITRNPGRVSAIYNPTAIAGAYKELIGAWDSEKAREGALDRLSAIEETFLRPELQGLGDILFGEDDRLYGLLNADLGDIGLGKAAKKAAAKGKPAPVKKAVARKAAKAASKPVAKRGPITKIKVATKKVAVITKKAGAGVKKTAVKAGTATKQATKKVGKAVVKGTTTPIRLGMLLAMKTNFGKIASRLYWGLFSQSEAAQHGVLADYWQAANRSWNHTRKIFVDKLKGSESALRQSIITGRAAKIAKRGTHGLGSTAELFTSGFEGLGITEAGVVAAASVLGPLLALLNKSFKGKKKTAGSSPETDANEGDTGENEPVSPPEADHVEDNYVNEVEESATEQEPEADGSVQEEEELEGVGEIGDREYDPQLGDLGKKIKSKAPATKTRIKKDKVAKKAVKVAKKATKKATKTAKKTVKVEKKAAKKAAPKKPSKIAAKTAHIANAQKNKKMSLTELMAKLKKAKTYSTMTPAQLQQAAIKLQNKTTAQIEKEAEVFADKAINESSSSNSTPSKNPSGGGKAPAPSYEDSMPSDSVNTEVMKTDAATNVATETTTEVTPEATEGMSTGAKVVTGLAIALGLAAIAKFAGKKKSAPVNGLGDLGKFTKKKHFKNVYELKKDAEKVQKMLKNKKLKLPHGYSVENRLNGKARVLKIK